MIVRLSERKRQRAESVRGQRRAMNPRSSFNFYVSPWYAACVCLEYRKEDGYEKTEIADRFAQSSEACRLVRERSMAHVRTYSVPACGVITLSAVPFAVPELFGQQAQFQGSVARGWRPPHRSR